MIRIHRYLAAFVIATTFVVFPAASFAGVFVGIGFGGGGGIGVSINIAPPPLPVYEQPPCDVADTIWTPGYWAYGPYGYYWVPGTWVEAPQVGYLWTPGYWGYGGGAYAWHGGYWGRHVGYYGGVNYGYGYEGNGYDGGGWNGNHFRYNTAYARVNRTTINNVYVNRTVVNDYGNTFDRTSYNGGPHGLRSRPTANDLAYRNERHFSPTQVQRQHVEIAAQNRNFRDFVNHGRPINAAVTSPLSRVNRDTNFNRATASRYAERTTNDPFSRFDRNSPSYANRTIGETNGSSRYERVKSPATDPYSRFDRNATVRQQNWNTYSRNSEGYQRNTGTYHPQNARPERSYAQTRGANTYHPQVSRPERSYGAAASHYHSEPAYRNAAPHAERPSERSRPAEHSEGHHSESNRHER